MHVRETAIVYESSQPNAREVARFPIDLQQDVIYVEFRPDLPLAAAIHAHLSLVNVEQFDGMVRNGFPIRLFRVTLAYHGPPLPRPFAYEVSLSGQDARGNASQCSLGTLQNSAGQTDEEWVLEGQSQTPPEHAGQLDFRTRAASINGPKPEPGRYDLLDDRFSMPLVFPAK